MFGPWLLVLEKMHNFKKSTSADPGDNSFLAGIVQETKRWGWRMEVNKATLENLRFIHRRLHVHQHVFLSKLKTCFYQEG